MSVEELDPDAVPGRPPLDGTAPRGPVAVREAALVAATDLFAQRGVRVVSVREVAQAAGVNPSLVHRYVGGKDALLEAVLGRLLDAMKVDLPAFAERADAPLPGPLAYAVATHQRIVAHLVMEGRDVRDFQAEFPVMDHIVMQIQQVHGVDQATARRRGALIYAHDLAIRLFMPVLLQAAGLGPEDADDLRQAIRGVNLRLSEID